MQVKKWDIIETPLALFLFLPPSLSFSSFFSPTTEMVCFSTVSRELKMYLKCYEGWCHAQVTRGLRFAQFTRVSFESAKRGNIVQSWIFFSVCGVISHVVRRVFHIPLAIDHPSLGCVSIVRPSCVTTEDPSIVSSHCCLRWIRLTISGSGLGFHMSPSIGTTGPRPFKRTLKHDLEDFFSRT